MLVECSPNAYRPATRPCAPTRPAQCSVSKKTLIFLLENTCRNAKNVVSLQAENGKPLFLLRKGANPC